MDNTQQPSAQPMMPIQPASPMGGMDMSGAMPTPGGMPGAAPGGMPMVQQVQLPPPKKRDVAGLVKTIVIVILSLVAVTFIGLFIWMMIEKNTLQEEWDTRTALEVAKAEDAARTAQAGVCAEEKKYPYMTFTGPVDYGQLSFQYPKTWSLYLERSAVNGGNLNAYFNPVQVNVVAKDTINALRVTISTDTFDRVIATYTRDVEKKNPTLTASSIEIGDAKNGVRTSANRYDGIIPGTELRGSIVVFKIRDKTVILETDSEVFLEEFNKLLDTIIFNA